MSGCILCRQNVSKLNPLEEGIVTITFSPEDSGNNRANIALDQLRVYLDSERPSFKNRLKSLWKAIKLLFHIPLIMDSVKVAHFPNTMKLEQLSDIQLKSFGLKRI
jgi:hypothetical protein